MSDVVEGRDASVVERGDAELITAVRSGDTAAYGVLFDRHRDAATRLARQLSPSDADDLVAESFTRVLALLQDGKGPALAFRAYLLTAVRRLHVDRMRATAMARPTDDEAELDRPAPSADRTVAAFESEAAAAAYASLPERWQMVLWHLDVEGEKPADVAPLLEMTPNSVSALAYRAREGLRQSYLQNHLSVAQDASCRTCTNRLAAYVRNGLSGRAKAEVESHLDECRRCTGLYLELIEVNRDLGGMLVPALLGVPAAGYVAAAAVAGTASAAVGAVGMKVALSAAAKGLAEPVKVAASALGPSGVAASAVVATVATAGIVTVTTESKEIPPPPTAAASPAPSATPEETPGPTPEPTPTEDAIVVPTPSPDPTPTVEQEAEVVEEEVPPVTEEPEPEPTPEPPPVGVTDFGIGAAVVTRDVRFFDRRVTIPVTADAEPHPIERTVTVRVDFDRRERFRGTISPGWTCDAALGQRLRNLTCTATLAPGEGGSLAFRVLGLRATGTVRVTAPDDPNASNDVGTLRRSARLLAL